MIQAALWTLAIASALGAILFGFRFWQIHHERRREEKLDAAEVDSYRKRQRQIEEQHRSSGS